MNLITQQFDLNDCSEFTKKIANQIGKEFDIDLSKTPYIRKGLVPSDIKFEDNETASIDYITTKGVDRDADIVLPQGAILNHYETHPIVLYCHNYKLANGELPLGRSMWIKSDKNGLISKTQYYTEDPDCMGAKVWRYRKAGFPMAKSIGFIPISYVMVEDLNEKMMKSFGLDENNIKGAERIFTKWAMTEYSDVPIPSNPEALQVAIAKGLDTKEDLSKKMGSWFVDIDFEPTEEKAKKIGFIDLEVKCEDCEEKQENLDVEKAETEESPQNPCKQEGGECMEDCEEYGTCEDEVKKSFNAEIKGVFIDGFGMVKFMKKFEELELKELLEIVYGNIKDFYHDNGSLKYLYYENLPENLKPLIKEYKTTAKGYMTDIVFREKSEAMEKLAGLLGIFKEVKNEDTIEDKGISDDSEAGLLDIPDNGNGEVDGIIEEKEVNLDEIIEKALEEVQEKEVEGIEAECERITKLFNSCRTKEVDLELMKKQYGEDFDIEKVKTEPASFEYNIFCKFLGCKIKNLFPTSFFIPSAMMGNYLSAFKTVFSKYKTLDQRNFYGNGGEIPLRFSSVQLNSKASEEFLTDGTRFYETEDKTQKFVTQIYPDWGGVRLDIYTTDKDASVQMNKSFVRDAVVWVKENNLLKGEKFSIHGEFLEKTNKGWDDVIFPSDADKSTIKKNVERLSKNSGGRGIMLIGPPGTGKTMTGKVLMEEDTTFIWASSKDFKYGANRALSLGFELCRELAPSIFFLEDIDTWIQGYTVDLLKTEMDGIRTNKGVLTILTSNFPEDIPEALIDRPGRFHHIINFSLPNKDNRIKLLKFFAENADKDIIEKFADMTEGFSGSHLKELVDFAKMICEDEGIEIGEALMKSLEQMKEQRQMISDIKAPKKKEFDGEIVVKDFIELKEPEKIDFEFKEKTVDVDFDPEEIKSMMKSAILTTVNDSKSMDKLVEERIRRMKGIIDFEDE